MKKLLNNKKILTSLIVVLLVITAAGSYSWFTSKSSASISSNMGRLSISSSAENLLGEPDYYYEPGDNLDMAYTIDNVHAGDAGEYKMAFVQANFAEGTVEIYSDSNGNALLSPKTYAIDQSIFEEMTRKVKTVIDSDTSLISAWYVDRTTGIYYALIDAGMDAAATVELKFDGSQMGNVYQGAKFHFSGEFLATQVNEDAIYDTFGLDLNNLDPIDENGNILSNGIRSTARAYYMNLLYEMLDL